MFSVARRRAGTGAATVALLTVSLASRGHGASPPGGAASPQFVAALVHEGQGAFAAGKMDLARDCFDKAFAADPKNTEAAADLGIVELRLARPRDAARPLAVAAEAKQWDRPLVLAMAFQYIADKSPMQGVKPLLAYLTAHPAAPDEPMLNALGIALAQADARGVKTPYYTDAAKSYQKLNAKLEGTRPGEKRWGVEWMPADDVNKKQTTIAAAQATIASQTAKIRTLTAQIADLQRQKNAVPHTLGNNNMTQKADALQRQIDQLVAERTKAQKELDPAQRTLAGTQPHWPENLPVESLALEGSDAAS